MESSFWFDTIFLGVRLKFFKCIFVRLSFYLNSEDPDEMLQCAAFHPGLHCLLKYPFRGFLYTKGLQSTGMTSEGDIFITSFIHCRKIFTFFPKSISVSLDLDQVQKLLGLIWILIF